MDNSISFEVELENNIKRNLAIFNEFSSWLKGKKLTTSTVEKHISNMEFFANEYLTYSKIIPIENSIDEIDIFLGSWFIKKASWSSSASIKSYTVTFKKFYSFLYEKKVIEKADFSNLNKLIKLNLDKWIQTLNRYENDNIDNITDVWNPNN